MRTLRLVAIGLGIAVVVGAAACGSSSRSALPSTTTRSTTTTPAQATVEEAIGAYVRSVGHDYAGDCATTTLEQDVGKHCSTLHEDRGTSRIYATGPTFSEFDTWLLLQLQGGRWSVVDSASAGTLDRPLPPAW